MKKLEQLIEIKRQLRLAEVRRVRAENKIVELTTRRKKVLDSITPDEARLYKERIERACEL